VFLKKEIIMWKRKLSTIVAALAVSIPISLTAVSSLAQTSADNGQAVQGIFVDREVTIRPDTKWVNVTGGETIRFVVEEPNGPVQSFTHRFYGHYNLSDVDLAKIAPPNVVLQHPVEVYISPNKSDMS
jgi:hypothetical protein